MTVPISAADSVSYLYINACMMYLYVGLPSVVPPVA